MGVYIIVLLFKTIMSGRISPFPGRNVKADLATSIVSAGLLGSLGPELLKVFYLITILY